MGMTTTKAPSPSEAFRAQLVKLSPELHNALPSNISPEKFQRVVLTVVNMTPELLNGDRRALFAACMRCASDGLVPDGREAALVMFKGKPQYLPMVGGILKRARNSGELLSISAHVIYERDEFLVELGDEERIVHKPAWNTDRGKMIGVYAVAKLKDGGMQRALLSAAEVEKVRNASASKNGGPWTTWPEEMWKKTALRRLSKYLPMDADAEKLFRRDDDLGKPQGDAEAAPQVIEGEADDAPVSTRLDALEGVIEGQADADPADAEATP